MRRTLAGLVMPTMRPVLSHGSFIMTHQPDCFLDDLRLLAYPVLSRVLLPSESSTVSQKLPRCLEVGCAWREVCYGLKKCIFLKYTWKCIPGVMVLRNGASGHESGVRALEAEGGVSVQLFQAGTYTISTVCVIPTS